MRRKRGAAERGVNGSSDTGYSNYTAEKKVTGMKKGPWTAEEDELLAEYVKKEGEGKWRTLPKKAGLLRCGKSCRLRWMNYLRPSVKRGHITADEEDLILRLHRLLGNRWSLIAGRIPGRTDNEIKNYWNTHLTKKLIAQGIDPKTHKPLQQLNPSSMITTSINYNPSQKPAAAVISNSSCHLSISPENATVTNNDNQLGDDEEMNGANKKLELIMTTSTNNNHDHDQAGIMISTTNTTDDDDEDDLMISCFPDDAFSSFLNSLINDDDMFINNNVINQHPVEPEELLQQSTEEQEPTTDE